MKILFLGDTRDDVGDKYVASINILLSCGIFFAPLSNWLTFSTSNTGNVLRVYRCSKNCFFFHVFEWAHGSKGEEPSGCLPESTLVQPATLVCRKSLRIRAPHHTWAKHHRRLTITTTDGLCKAEREAMSKQLHVYGKHRLYRYLLLLYSVAVSARRHMIG